MSNLKFAPGVYQAIDCGTASIRTLAIEVTENGDYTTVHNSSVEHDIGRNLTELQALAPETIETLITSTQQFMGIAQELGAKSIVAAATESLRSAANGAEVLERLAAEAMPFQMLSGLDELQTSLMGVLPHLRQFKGQFYFADSGGGSTELGIVNADDFSVVAGDSLQIGVAPWSHRFEAIGEIIDVEHLDDAVDEMTAQFAEAMDGWPTLEAGATLAVAGAPMNLFRYVREIVGSTYDIEDRTMHRAEVEKAAHEIAAMRLAAREAHPYIDSKGVGFLLPCALKILALMNVTNTDKIYVLHSGICVGLCLQSAKIELNKAV